MPLVRIEIIKGKDVGYKKELLDAVHTALVNAIQIEEWDRFQRLYEIEDDFCAAWFRVSCWVLR